MGHLGAVLKLVGGQSQDREVHPGHPLHPPIVTTRPDRLVQIVPPRDDPKDQSLGELPRALGHGHVLLERAEHPVQGLDGPHRVEIQLEEHSESRFPAASSGTNQRAVPALVSRTNEAGGRPFR